eukprot:940307_1
MEMRSVFNNISSHTNQFNLRTLLFFTWMINIVAIHGSTIECAADYECENEHLQCAEGAPCTIICSGRSSCRSSTMYCADNDHCNVICSGRSSCAESTVHCVSASHPCFVECTGEQGSSCAWMNINGLQARSIFVDVSSDWGLVGANIRCPKQGTADDCIVRVHDVSLFQHAFETQTLSFYSVHSFDDITLRLTNCTDWGAACTAAVNLKMFCTENYQESCVMRFVNDKWQCQDTNATCNQNLYPSHEPTSITSLPTNTPTISPINDPPYSSDHILYIRQDGCDFGECSSDLFRHDLYCKNIKNAVFYQPEFSTCCSHYDGQDPPMNHSTEIPADCDGSYVSINETKVYHNSAFNTYADVPLDSFGLHLATWRPMCFYVETDFICHLPKIEVQFEATLWSLGDFNVGYKNQSNALNTAECKNKGVEHRPGVWTYGEECGRWVDCPIDSFAYLGDPGDGPWLSGFKNFYAKFSRAKWRLQCLYNATLNVTTHTRMSVECHAKPQYACGTLDYSIDCLAGLGNCSVYDGSGVIDIGDGVFYLNRTMSVKQQQIILKGAGYPNGTVIQHTLPALQEDNVLIRCGWQCYLTLQTLKYSAPIRNSSIIVTNGGHMTFDRVLFEDFVPFIIDGMATNVTFFGCEFSDHQPVFLVRSGAHVLFKECKFQNNSLSVDLFTVNDGSLVFQDTSFIKNKGSFIESLINANGDASLQLINCVFYKNEALNTLVHISSIYRMNMNACQFIANTNINRLLYASNANEINIWDTMITDDNLCISDHCMHVLNSNLSIDEQSVSLQGTPIPTLSPTAPSNVPTMTPIPPTHRPSEGPTTTTTGVPTSPGSNITTCGNRCWDVDVYPSGANSTAFMVPIQIEAPDEHINYTVNFDIKGVECMAPSVSFLFEQIISWSSYDDYNYSRYKIWNNGSSLNNANNCPRQKDVLDSDIFSCDHWTMCLDNYRLRRNYRFAAGSTTSFYIEQTAQPSGKSYCSVYPLTTNAKLILSCSTTFYPTRSPTLAPTNLTLEVVSFEQCGENAYCRDYDIDPGLDNRSEFKVDIWGNIDGTELYLDINFISSTRPCTEPKISFEFAENDFNSPDTEYLDLFDHDGVQIAHCTGSNDYNFNHTIQCLERHDLLVDEFMNYTITVYKSQYVDNLYDNFQYYSAWGNFSRFYYEEYGSLPEREYFFSINAILTLHCTNHSNSNTPATETFPTPNPTMWPTHSTKVLLYGHAIGNRSTVTSTLTLIYPFSPYRLEHLIDFTQFGRENGSVVYGPCTPSSGINTTTDLIFNEWLATLKTWYGGAAVISETVYPEKHVKQSLHCDTALSPDICYLKCSGTCVSSTLKANASGSFIECSDIVSCSGAMIDVSSSLHGAVLCSAEDSCTEAKINAYDVLIFSLECTESGSCSSATVNITNSKDIQIHCYAKDACSNINIYSDNDDTEILIYQFSENVNIHVPKGLHIHETLNCNPLDAYVLFDGSISLNDSIDHYFDGHLPCSSVWFWFTEINRVQCEIRYTESLSHRIFDYLYDIISCFIEIFVEDLFDFDCYGTWSPTQAPSFSPTLAPSDSPTNVPTIAPSHAPTLNPSSAPSVAPSLSPSVSPSNAPSDIPSAAPSAPPTNAPSNAPSHVPSVAPTTPPTHSPSNAPTDSPSVAPTLNPSVAPSDAPSVAPTRYPTMEDIYGFWIDIELHLSNLTVVDINTIATDPIEFVQTFQTSVEEALVSADMFHGLDSRLQYRYFETVFEKINKYKVNVKANYFDESLTAPRLIQQDTSIDDPYTLQFSGTIDFNSHTTGSSILLTIQTQEDFTRHIESKLEAFFHHQGVQCDVNNAKALQIAENIEIDDTIQTILIYAITGLVGLIIIWQLAVYVRRKCKETEMCNALVVNVAIGEYVRPEIPEFVVDNDIPNLAVDNDVNNLYPLFMKLNYNVMGSEPPRRRSERMKLYWSEKEVMELLDDAARELTANRNVYDGLIVIFSCHGWEGNVITSDYRLIDKNAIHRLFSIQYPGTRTIPRMFLFDCCEGSQRKQKGGSVIQPKGTKDGGETGKQVLVESIIPKDENANIWGEDEVNPDYKLIEIHASNLGFQSLMSSQKGSYLLNGFKDELRKNLFGNQCCRREKNLGEIFGRIQNNLHKKGIQQIKKVFNNDTDYLLIRKNEKVKPKLKQSTGEQIELQNYKFTSIPNPKDETKYEEEEDISIQPAVDGNTRSINEKAAQSMSLIEDATATETQSILGNDHDDDDDDQDKDV